MLRGGEARSVDAALPSPSPHMTAARARRRRLLLALAVAGVLALLLKLFLKRRKLKSTPASGPNTSERAENAHIACSGENERRDRENEEGSFNKRASVASDDSFHKQRTSFSLRRRVSSSECTGLAIEREVTVAVGAASKQFAAFISHTKGECSMEARFIQEKLESTFDRLVFLDRCEPQPPTSRLAHPTTN